MLRLSRLCKLRCSRYFSHVARAVPEDFGCYTVILPQEPFVFGTAHIKPRSVPDHISRPSYSKADEGRIRLGTHEETRVRQAGKLAKNVREFAKSLVEVGTTTNSIDSAIHDFIIQHSAYPAPLRYRGFPRSCCTSVNNIIAHGIPDDRKLEDGDIINIDVTVYINGYHGDTSQTFLVGDVDEPGKELIIITNAAVEHGISACGPGKPFNIIGKAIHQVISENNYSVSSMFTGHGIGRVFHSPPYILHHPNENSGVMVPGDCFTIEPCIIQGKDPQGWIFPDGWTASTENCARSACAEHTILITENGVEVLTR